MSGEAVEGCGYEGGDAGCVAAGGADHGADVEVAEDAESYEGKRESMSRQREARGSFDGTGEGESSEGGAAEVEVGSVGSMRYLISLIDGQMVVFLFVTG